MLTSDNQPENPTLNLREWTFIKDRGALAKKGEVYQSADRQTFLRTGPLEEIRSEAAWARDMTARGFPVPTVTAQGVLPDGRGYFAETSAGKQTFGAQLRADYEKSQAVSDDTFHRYLAILVRFYQAQLRPENRSAEASQLRRGIQLDNVLEQNPDVPPSLLENAVSQAENRVSRFPLVLTHGDLAPFNVMDDGVIDFESRFIAPFGYDVVTAILFQRFWDHPKPDQTGTMKRWEWTGDQVAEYLARVDAVCLSASVSTVSPYLDDFLLLKAVWALSYEKPDDLMSAQARRWQWRKRVAVYCATRYLAGAPIDSASFRTVGLGQDVA